MTPVQSVTGNLSEVASAELFALHVDLLRQLGRDGEASRLERTAETADTPSTDSDGSLSIAQAAHRLGVAPGTLRSWILSGAVPEPGTVRVGMKTQRRFSDEWLKAAQQALETRNG